MSSAELSARVLTQLSVANDAFDPPPLGEKQKRNTANVMKEIQLQRLQGNGQQLIRQRGSHHRASFIFTHLSDSMTP